MQVLLLALFMAIFSLDYLSRISGLVHPAVSLVPEALSGIAILLVVGRLVSTKRLDVHIKYLLFFFLFGLHLVNGILINETPAGSIVAGLRVYLKYLPFFFAPLVFEFTPRQVRAQFLLLGAILVLQLPTALMQRFVLYADKGTGDVVRGSLETGSFLSIVLISAIAVCLGLYLKKVISGAAFWVLLVLLFLPTTMNETKGTLILFPIACALPMLMMEGRKLSRVVFMLGGLGCGAFLVYSAIFTYTQSAFVGHTDNILEFFQRDRLENYLAPRTAELDISEDRYGRIDVLVVAWEDISVRPLTALAGFGMGSVTKAPIAAFSGVRADYYADMGITETAAPFILLETGLLGALLWLWFFVMLFRDARAVSRQEGLIGGLALGWTGVIAVMLVGVFYKNIITVNGIMFVFWYMSGTIVAARCRAEAAAWAAAAVPSPWIDAVSPASHPSGRVRQISATSASMLR